MTKHRPHPAGDDCLTLNIWSPVLVDGAGLPVMVWIYGGAYAFGKSSEDSYDGTLLAREGNVVVVTFNYRVGVEGFMDIDGAPPNRGLLDQVAALAWVRDNICGFGGDPSCVTIFGQSAGAGSIVCLLAMPRAAGLFRRAIAQSLPGCVFTRALARDIAAAIAHELDATASVNDLRDVDALRLAEATGAVAADALRHEQRWGLAAHLASPFAPVIDGEVLPTTPWQALQKGAARDVDLIVGHCRNEARLHMAFDGTLGNVGPHAATAALRLFGPGPESDRSYREAFPGATAEELYELVRTDHIYRIPSLRAAEAQTSGGGTAYVYELVWSAPARDGALGACHNLDVPLTFGTLTGHLGFLIGEAGRSEAAGLSALVRGAWTSFAATGEPGWPAYDDEHRLAYLIDLDPVVARYPEDASHQLWRDYTFEPLALHGPRNPSRAYTLDKPDN
jgi:para-nitrobenzyl esterase